MAWWGTFIGGALGYVFAGPLGALIGAALGGNFDRGISMGDRFDTRYGDTGHSAGMGVGDQQRVQLAFFTATFSVMGYIAKADGHVSKAEIRAAEDIMAQMQLSAEQRKAAIKLFDQGKSADFPFEDVLRQFKQECHRRSNLVQMFIEIQIATALSDGSVDPGEKRVLYRIGEVLGFSRSQIDHLFNIASGARPSADDTLTLSQAYKILGVDKSSTDAEIKKAYRRLMSQHHPDKLVAKGLPEEMIQLATEKTQEIRKAYDLVRSKRA